MASSSAGPADGFPGGAEEAEQEQGLFLRHPGLCYRHVPQLSRLGKLRFPREQSRAFSLSLDSTAPPWIRSRPAFGPFTGYAAVLGRSRFLEPARRILEEVCQVGQPRRRAGDPEEESPPPAASPVSRLDSMLDEVSNWFINARVRLWKPMVEEVHTLEMRKKSKISQIS